MKLAFLNHWNHKLDSWLKTPEKNAAGNLGLFRILYSIFYLWYLSYNHAIKLAALPSEQYSRRIFLIEFLPKPLPNWLFEGLETSVVVFLILLLFGLRTRLATLGVLVTGCFLEAYYYNLDSEHASILLIFYIPLIMFTLGNWGDTYSVDAWLKRRKQKEIVSPNDSFWTYSIAIRFILVILALLWFTSGISKMLGGTWLWDTDMMANHVLKQNIKAAIYDLPLNPLAPWVAQTPFIHNFLRFFTVFFEATFFLALLNTRLRYFYLSLALVFHSVNALWFVVTFTPVLIVYGLFIDWQDLWQKSFFSKIKISFKIPTFWLKIIPLSLAISAGILWNANEGLRSLINLGGWLDWRTIWYPIFPLSLVWFVISCLKLFKRDSLLNQKQAYHYD